MVLAIRKASKSILRDYGEIDQLQASQRGTDNFLINTEKKIKKNLMNELVKSRPAWSIMFRGNNLQRGQDEVYTWVIEHLDGASNLSNGIPYFCTSIAVKHQKEIIAAVIYDSLRDEMFVSEKGSGSFLNDRRLRVSEKKSIKNGLFSTNLNNTDSQNDREIFGQLEKLKKEQGNIRILGAPALDFAHVAAGRLDGTWHNYLDFCQIAAGSLIISEAGGIVETKEIGVDGFSRKNTIASNAELFTKLLSILS